MGRVRGPRPQLERIDISHLSEVQRHQMAEGLRYALMGVRDFDKYWKRVSNTLWAINSGRSWLTRAQHQTAEFCLKKYIEEMNQANDFVKKGKK